jgi:hypothetical protein
MSRLLEFPNETLLQIIEEVVQIELENLTLSCKRFGILGEKALQKHRLRKANYTKINCIPAEPRLTKYLLHPTELLRDVLVDRDIAPYPEIVIAPRFFSREKPTVEAIEEASQVLHGLDKKIEAAIEQNTCGCRGYGDDWGHKIFNGDLLATFTLLLYMLPNVRSLSANLQLRLRSKGLPAMISRIGACPCQHGGEPHALSKLAEASVQEGDCRSLLPFGGIPSLRSLHGIDMYDFLGNADRLKYGSAVTTLTLENSTICVIAVEQLIQNIKGLKHFKLSYNIVGRPLAPWAPSVIVQSLVKSAHGTLETLDLTSGENPGKFSSSWRGKIFIGYLRGFRRLERIRINNDMFEMMWDEEWKISGIRLEFRPVVELLPRSVVSLTLTLPVVQGGASWLLQGLAGQKKDFPKLKEIVFEDSNDLDEDTEACNGVGISIRHLKQEDIYSSVVQGFETLKLH